MDKKSPMKNILTFGKFLPFHKGHQAMIEFALSKGRVTVVVCNSDKETLSGLQRKVWIEKTVGCAWLDVIVFNYSEDDLSSSSEASEEISEAWAKEFKKLVPDATHVVTSEDYGDYVAKFMGIEHIPFDKPRNIVPVSATKIRNGFQEYWGFVPDVVKEDISFKIVIAGTESTGKSTLSRRLANHYGFGHVKEAGRVFIPTSKKFDEHDLDHVAKEHYRWIKESSIYNPVLVCDTDINTTIGYHVNTFGGWPSKYEHIPNGDLYLYLNNDVEHVQDGTRLEKSGRDWLDTVHRQVFYRKGIDIVEISGDWNSRFEQSKKAIEKELTKYISSLSFR
jgi:HTH-type transcriptional regulator, transcriptional repressor of NAD biosynthesis genes